MRDLQRGPVGGGRGTVEQARQVAELLEGCHPSSRWVKADRLHPLVPRESKRWKSLYRGRAADEREFGRLKNEWAQLPLRVRWIERVRLHADLTILAKLAFALARSAPILS